MVRVQYVAEDGEAYNTLEEAQIHELECQIGKVLYDAVYLEDWRKKSYAEALLAKFDISPKEVEVKVKVKVEEPFSELES